MLRANNSKNYITLTIPNKQIPALISTITALNLFSMRDSIFQMIQLIECSLQSSIDSHLLGTISFHHLMDSAPELCSSTLSHFMLRIDSFRCLRRDSHIRLPKHRNSADQVLVHESCSSHTIIPKLGPKFATLSQNLYFNHSVTCLEHDNPFFSWHFYSRPQELFLTCKEYLMGLLVLLTANRILASYIITYWVLIAGLLSYVSSCQIIL